VDACFHDAWMILSRLLPCPGFARSGDFNQLVKKALVMLIAGIGVNHFMDEHPSHGLGVLAHHIQQADQPILADVLTTHLIGIRLKN
jgi:hypothetical protein